MFVWVGVVTGVVLCCSCRVRGDPGYLVYGNNLEQLSSSKCGGGDGGGGCGGGGGGGGSGGGGGGRGICLWMAVITWSGVALLLSRERRSRIPGMWMAKHALTDTKLPPERC